ncbi:MAG: SdpI family protein [archaeon]
MTIAWNLGYMFSMTLLLVPALAALFFCAGVLISKAKRNWFIGIRTPWTLSSDAVWDKTHELGGKLFKLSGILALAGMLFGDYAFWFVLAPVLAFSLFLVYYSYRLFNEEKEEKLKARLKPKRRW